MSEAILIEIERRFRQLEDALVHADNQLGRSENYHDRTSRNYCDTDSMHARQMFEKHSNIAVELMDLREKLKRCSEACCDDINRMQDEIRSRQRSIAA